MLMYKIEEVILKSESKRIELLIFSFFTKSYITVIGENRKKVLEYLETFDTQNFDSKTLLSIIEII